MITGIDIANFCIVSIGLTISIFGLFFASQSIFIEKWLKKYFMVLFSIATAYVASDFTSQVSLVLLGKDFAALSKAAVFMESLFSSMLMPTFSVSILYLCNEKLKSFFLYLNIGVWLIYCILLIITQFTNSIYYITPDNVYMRGPLYPVLLAPPVILFVINLIGVYRRRHLVPKWTYHSFLVYLFIPMIATIVQMFSYGLLLIVLGTTLSVMFMFINIIIHQVEKDIRQSREIATQQLTIRTLQMRPHFIYNTLTNIYYLCQQNPQKAQAAIADFTKYLRKNFTAITKEELIPFEEELEHAKAYLAVVKVRFEELLFVEYDTTFTAFKLPPLTLEPIVENSVKHNLDPDSPPLHILVSTSEKEGVAVIRVEDNGTGFESIETIKSKISDDEEESHIGLSNVKNRLGEMCGGTLELSPRVGGGTVVTITIPKAYR